MIDDPESNGSHPGAWARMLRHNWRDVQTLTDEELRDEFIIDRIMVWEMVTHDEAKRIWQREIIRRDA